MKPSARQSGLSPFIRRAGRRPLILAHRGARRSAPENTLVAFELAIQQGADGVELDVRMSRDGQLFVCHDDELELQDPHQRALLSHLDSGQIRALRTRSGEPIPTLRDALLFAARTGALLNIELKGDVPAPLYMARRAAEQVRVHGGGGIVMSSFFLPQVWQLARLLPAVPVAQLLHSASRIPPSWFPLELSGAAGAHPQFELLSPRFISKLRARVDFVGTWTVNDPKEARLAAKWGVDTIITDVPDIILAAL